MSDAPSPTPLLESKRSSTPHWLRSFVLPSRSGQGVSRTKRIPWTVVFTTAVTTFLLALPGCRCSKDQPPTGPRTESPSSSSKPAKHRACEKVGRERLVGPGGAGQLDEILPFATEIGNGIAMNDGFAASALRQSEHGTEAVVVATDGKGSNWRQWSLGEVHGDADPPKVVSNGKVLGVALLKPTGASRTLVLARLEEKILWGAEVRQGLDPSMAFDVALGDTRGVAVWDDTNDKDEVSEIRGCSFDANSFAGASKPTPLTLPGTDADTPRILRDPAGGYWVWWIAHKPAPAPQDQGYHAEDISFRWIEVAHLDDAGKIDGASQRVSSQTGHVQAYDVTVPGAGQALVAWRDDDTPSGSAGGTLWIAKIDRSGVSSRTQVAVDDVKGVGEPRLLQGWLAIADARGKTLLGSWKTVRELESPALFPEPAIGAGDPLAASGNFLLVARPSGRASRIYVTRCFPPEQEGSARSPSPSPSASASSRERPISH